jgi:hypothetical protein
MAASGQKVQYVAGTAAGTASISRSVVAAPPKFMPQICRKALPSRPVTLYNFLSLVASFCDMRKAPEGALSG